MKFCIGNIYRRKQLQIIKKEIDNRTGEKTLAATMLLKLVQNYIILQVKKPNPSNSLQVSIDLKQTVADINNQGPYSPTILKNILCLVLQIFLYLAAFECNTTSDWLNHTV